MERIRTIEEFKVGDDFSFRKVVSDEVVRAFADLSGDHNRVHLDDTYARATRFGRRIAHGALLMAFLSKALGMDLPGPGAVYLSQTLEFLAPVYVGDEIEISVRVEEVDLEARVLAIANTVRGPGGAEVARGVSRVKLPKRKSS
jgi:3-hydroxybutyryl-CoA dehydratase